MDRGRARRCGGSVILASWLAVFCLFGYRATFAILKGPMAITLGWSDSRITLGYVLMMVLYAVAAAFSGLILDRWGTRPVYAIAAALGSLGFLLTARVDSHLAYLLTFGILGGIATGMLWVTSTVSVRTWFVGRSYATMWGLAFSGAPMAQFALAQVVRPTLARAQADLDLAARTLVPGAAGLSPGELAFAIGQKLQEPATLLVPGVREALGALESAWRTQMTLLGLIVLAALAVAVLAARKVPGHYGLQPFGAIPDAPAEPEWTLGRAFSRYAVWGAILTFLASMVGEFLVWTQVVGYWTRDVGFGLEKATRIYGLIGLMGIVSMPLMGRVADRVVGASGGEAQGRRRMLVAGPALGAAACLLLLAPGDLSAYAACLLFALYWAVVPGGVVGYTGAVYGGRSLGRIWGLATLIVMGLGPPLGAFAGAALRDLTGRCTASILFAFGAFAVSSLLATTLPLATPAAKELP